MFSSIESFYDADFDDIPSYEFNGEKCYLSDLIDWRIDASNILNGNGEIDSSFYTIGTITSGTTLTTASGEFANTAFQQTGKYLLPSGTTDGDVEYLSLIHI